MLISEAGRRAYSEAVEPPRASEDLFTAVFSNGAVLVLQVLASDDVDGQ